VGYPYHTAMERHLPYEITVLAATQQARLVSIQAKQASTRLTYPRGMGDWVETSVVSWDGLPVRRQTPIQVVTTW